MGAYTLYSNKPYVVLEEDVETFLENSKNQGEIIKKAVKLFPKECFDFKRDDKGILKVTIDVDRKIDMKKLTDNENVLNSYFSDGCIPMYLSL